MAESEYFGFRATRVITDLDFWIMNCSFTYSDMCMFSRPIGLKELAPDTRSQWK